MDIALVTGAERGTGLKIAQKLIDLGLRVYALSHDFTKCHFQHPEFFPVVCDLTSRESLEKAWEQIRDRDPVVSCLVHAARHEPTEPLEATRPEEIEYTLNTALLCPMVLSRLAAPSLMKTHGHVILVGRDGVGGPVSSASLAAADAGLFAFGQALFEELRDTGVKVCTLTPRRNTGESDPKGRQRLQPQSEIDNALLAEAVEMVINFKGHNAISHLVVRPQGQREDPLIPTAIPELTRAKHSVVLPPPEKRSAEEELIPTPKRQRPADAPPPGEQEEAEEAEEDDVLDQLLEESRELLRKQRDLAKSKLEKTEEKRRQAERPRIIPTDEAAEATKPAPEMTEESRREAAAARARLASLLGIPADEPDAEERLTEAAERIVSEQEAAGAERAEAPESGAEREWWQTEDDAPPADFLDTDDDTDNADNDFESEGDDDDDAEGDDDSDDYDDDTSPYGAHDDEDTDEEDDDADDGNENEPDDAEESGSGDRGPPKLKAVDPDEAEAGHGSIEDDDSEPSDDDAGTVSAPIGKGQGGEAARRGRRGGCSRGSRGGSRNRSRSRKSDSGS